MVKDTATRPLHGPSPVYQWKVNSNAVATTATYASATLQTGDVVSVTLTSNAQCATTPTASGNLTVTVYPLPAPVITRSGATLNAGAPGTTYTWLLNGVAIAGATGATWIPVQNGTYSVAVTDAHGCVGTSPDFEVHNVGIAPLSGSPASVSYYPNPARSIVNITVASPVNAAVLSVEGKLLLSANNTRQIDISSLPDGLYILRITNTGGEVLKIGKLIKLMR